ncbi:MAG: hypothetical protein GX224_02845 [Thermoplasmatales archaeon]|nr:hypothetical protein [Thermoplasmatales archaeon]
MEIILFTKNDCEKCDYVLERIPAGLDVKVLNAEGDGLAEAAYYEILELGFPVLVVDDEIVAEGGAPVVKKLKECAGE